MSCEQELGYQYLNTAFSGTINPALSGNEYFPFFFGDVGSANNVSQGEAK